ncbi:DUF4403 family protein [Burkholderia sp. MBR-1]|uniref:DUF4403 family protein n=1 Tax=Burkholderia sp. MBR-1 TaxID=2732364 RepID=UPI0015EF7CEA|nr:DUF4403 family protein [Burkholderia sp. MBR-1]QMI49802.1 DUF4403 family protein [Burkholderia sp. MBR-1]
MLKSRKSTAGLLYAASLTLILTGCHKATKDETIFQEPPREAPIFTPPPPADTKLTAVARLPYSILKTALQAKASEPVQLADSQHLQCGQVPYVIGPRVTTKEACMDVPYVDLRGAGMQRQCTNVPTVEGPTVGTKEQCADFNWHATVQPEGEPSIGRAGDAIRVSIPLAVSGQGGVTGDLAKVLSLSAKNFEAHAIPGGDIRASFDENWCPKIDVTPTDRWVSDAKVEAVGKNCVGIDLGPLGHPQVCAGPANVDLTGPANKAIDQQHDKIREAAAAVLSCETVRAAVQAKWIPISIPIQVADDAKVFLNIKPTAAAVSSLVAEDDAAKMVLQVSAQTTVGPTPASADALPLPALGQADPSSESNLDVHVQATAPYTMLTDILAKEIVGKDFSKDTAAGSASLHVDEVNVYPSGKSLVVGVRVTANIPGRIFNTRGWVYLLGDPVAGSDGTSVHIDNFRYAAVLDNQLWNAIVSVFDARIKTVLRDHSTVDLSSSIQKARDDLLHSVNSASVKGVTITAPSIDMKLDNIVLGPTGFVVNAMAMMPFSLAINALPS